MTRKLLGGFLELSLPGRISRKIVYVLRRVHAWLGPVLDNIYVRLPYVRRVERDLDSRRLRAIAKYYLHLRGLLPDFPVQPRFSILVPVYRTNPVHLRECLDSVLAQVWTGWQLCIVDDGSADPAVTAVLEEYRQRCPGQISIHISAANQHICHASNHALAMADGDYTVLLDHDDRLLPNALAELVRAINLHQSPEILYSDERIIAPTGEKLDVPVHKPAWSPLFHLCVHYTTHLTAYKTALVRGLGGFRPGFEGAQDYDLMLRAVEAAATPPVHVPMCLYQWRAHAASTARSLEAKPYAADAGTRAVTEALARRGLRGRTAFDPHTLHYRLTLDPPAGDPLVSIIIPSKDSHAVLSTCIDSIRNRSTWKNFELIIADNGTTEPAALAYYARLGQEMPGFFRVSREVHPFNFARQVNRGVRLARGEYILILNNDTEVITPGWIEVLLGLAAQPAVGAVGCKLLYPDNTIQHAGIVGAGRSIALHAGMMCGRHDDLYRNYLNTTHEVFAVSAACLMTRKSLWESIRGLDELYLANGYGDVELCIRLRQLGLSCVYTPDAELYHHESKTRGLNIEQFEKHYFMRRYGQDLMWDPYLNPNLDQAHYYTLDGEFNYRWLDLNHKELMFFNRLQPDQWLTDAACQVKA